MKLRELSLVFSGVTLAALFVACGPGGNGGDAGVEAKLSVLKDEIFVPRCGNASCHGGANPSAGLKLDADDLHAELVDVDSSLAGWKYVVAGDPANSLILQILKGPVDGVPKMPQGLSLDDADIQLVEEWIANGANND